MCKIEKCPYCESQQIIKNGRKKTGVQNYKCKDCKKQFLENYQYNGAKPEMEELIIKHLDNNVGMRSMAKILKISRNTINRKIKKKRLE